jgi:rare lipoprotein A
MVGFWGCAITRTVPAPAGTPAPAKPPAAPGRPQVGLASWYGEFHHGLRTASGETFDMGELTAAHRTLPLGTHLRVTNLENGRMVRVRVNDRGPYVDGRVIDLSRAAARSLDMVERGVVPVRLDVVGP